jgi:hypothetical protein
MAVCRELTYARRNVGLPERHRILLPALVLLFTAGCANASPTGTPEPPPSANERCNDSINASMMASPRPRPAHSGEVDIGSGDTFFMGTDGARWGESVEFYGGAFHMKIGIYALDSQPPQVSVL